jgi:hypothetical protein
LALRTGGFNGPFTASGHGHELLTAEGTEEHGGDRMKSIHYDSEYLGFLYSLVG